MNQEEVVWEESPQVANPIYKIEERPDTWWECLLYGWQHTLVDISPFVLPLAVAGAIKNSGSPQSQWFDGASFINFCLFAMGIATLLQTTIGNRLPIIQGPSATLTGTLKSLAASGVSIAALWGGIFIGAILEMLIGASRILGALRRFFPISVAGVVVITIGFSLGQVAIIWTIGDGSATNFYLAAAVVAMIFVLQVGCRNVLGGLLARGSIFFSIWIVGLGISGLLGLVKWDLVSQKPWFALPGLFPYGGPGFSVGNFVSWEFSLAVALGIFAGYLGSMVESIGDYAATCAVSGEKYRVNHMNRGIFSEGLGCAVASVFGGMPCTSYTQNIGIIATTKVASRFVVQIAAVILIIYGLCPKFGALLVAMPRPVLGAVFIIVCGMIAVSGIRLLAATPNTSANSFLIGMTLICAIGIPHVVKGKPWLKELSSFPKLVLTNPVVLAVLMGILMNLVLNIILKGEEEG